MRTPHLLPLAVSFLVFGVASCGGDDDAASSGDSAPATDVSVATEVTTADVAATDMTGMDTTAPETETADTTATTAGGAAAPMAATVEIADFAFGPAEITIAAGGTVTWTNTDSQAHTATSADNFDTGAIASGASATVTFDEPGTSTYICSFHPFMTATVTVV